MEPTYTMDEQAVSLFFILWTMFGIAIFGFNESDSLSKKQKIALCLISGPFFWGHLFIAGICDFVGFIIGKKSY